jgi:hypothetical protein
VLNNLSAWLYFVAHVVAIAVAVAFLVPYLRRTWPPAAPSRWMEYAVIALLLLFLLLAGGYLTWLPKE